MKRRFSRWFNAQWRRRCLAFCFAVGLLLSQVSSHLFLAPIGQAMEAKASLPKAPLHKDLGIIEQAQAWSNASIQHQRLGNWSEAQHLSEASLDLLSQHQLVLQNSDRAIAYATTLGQALNTQASLSFALGNSEAALEQWQQAEAAYRKGQDEVGVVRSRINQAQALQMLGFYRRAIAQLADVAQTLGLSPNVSSSATVLQEASVDTVDTLKITTLQRWGELLRLTGDIPLAQSKLEQGLDLAQQLQQTPKVPSFLLSLGYLAQANDEPKRAMERYGQAVEQAATGGNLAVQAKANLAQFNLHLQQSQEAQAQEAQAQKSQAQKAQAREAQAHRAQAQKLWPVVLDQLSQLPLQQSTLYQRLQLIQQLAKASTDDGSGHSLVSLQQLQTLTTETLDQAQTLGDPRSRAYAFGNQGKIQLLQKQFQASERSTRAALEIAQSLQAPEMLWRWQGQLGDIRLQRKDREGAIRAYRSAVAHLNRQRGDLVAMHPNLQYSFQEDVEPLYRQLIGLLLEGNDEAAETDGAKDDLTEAQQLVEELQGIELDSVAVSPGLGPSASRQLSASRQPSTSKLTEAQRLMEDLQLMELEDFLRQFCNDSPAQRPVAELDSDAAILRFIVLRDRVEILANFPKQPLKRYRTNIAQADLEQQLDRLRRTLVIRSRRQFFKPSQQLYDELIRPLEADLAAQHTKTLIFALDGALQSVPMAALHDGEQYLAERYSIALVPRLQLPVSATLDSGKLQNILAVGLSQSRNGFSALPQVEQELSSIAQNFPGGQRLQDQAFTEANFQTHLQRQDPSIVHIATHGQFSSRAKETFLLAWDSLIHLGRLDELIQSGNERGNRATELLVLSACETAVGDQRASLGLAGVAFKAGARSTLATLWAVNDEASAIFMERFYEALKQPGTTRAEALRQAQRSLLKDPTYKHPLYWAPYILLGSWW